MHSLQVNVGLDRVSPAPCPSHTLLTKIQTNLRDRLEHTVLLGLCPPQPVSQRNRMLVSAFLPVQRSLRRYARVTVCLCASECPSMQKSIFSPRLSSSVALPHFLQLSFTLHPVCFSQTLSWSGSHRVNSGEELLYTQSRLSVTGRPHQCSLTVALTNSSTAQSSNVSLFAEVNNQ